MRLPLPVWRRPGNGQVPSPGGNPQTGGQRRSGLDDALTLSADFTQWIHHADAKAGWLAVVHGTLVAALTTQPGTGCVRPWSAGPARLVLVAASVLPLLAVAAAVLELGRSQLPRIGGLGANAFAFVPPTSRDGPVDADRFERDAWAYAGLLGRIAQQKLVHVRRATWATQAAALLTVACLLVQHGCRGLPA